MRNLLFSFLLRYKRKMLWNNMILKLQLLIFIFFLPLHLLDQLFLSFLLKFLKPFFLILFPIKILISISLDISPYIIHITTIKSWLLMINIRKLSNNINFCCFLSKIKILNLFFISCQYILISIILTIILILPKML